jgi:phosphatidylserine/phosphatidylglycerophosphate/cardiolipin synthase-like enzyme
MKLSQVSLRVRAFSLTAFLICTVPFFGQSTFAVTKDSSAVRPGLYDNSQGSPLVALIDQANSTLDMEIYEMDDPKVIQSIRSAIKRGVVVNIVKEPRPVGASCKVFESLSSNTPRPSQPGVPAPVENQPNTPVVIERTGGASCDDQTQLVSEVINAGGQYAPFAKAELCGGNGAKQCLEHGKLAVVDSELALISSGNFNTTSLCDLDYSPKTCNRDYSYVTDEGAVTKAFHAVVAKDVLGQGYDVGSVLGSDVAERVTVGPNSLDPLISFIETAKQRIQIENQYLKDPTLNAALIKMAKKGIRIQIVVASACSFGKPRPTDVQKITKIFGDFEKAGIATRMFTKNIRVGGNSGYLHAKAIVVDGKKAWVGSVNGSTQALTLNREFGIFFDKANEVKKLASIIESDFADPHGETWQESLQCAEND